MNVYNTPKFVYLSLFIYPPISGCCSVAKSYATLGNPMDCSMPGFLLEFVQTHLH